MFRNTSLASTPTFKLVLGFGLCTLGGAMLYTYFKNRNDDDDEQTGKKRAVAVAAVGGGSEATAQKDVCIKLEVSNNDIPLIAGRNGANLSLIEEKTRTRIRFRDKNDKVKFCDINGQPDAVKEARALILKEIERPPIVKEEILVPQNVCGQIMGRCGDSLKEICRISLAKVELDASGRSGGGMDKRRIIITGTRPQVNIARKLIEDKIEEDEELRRAMEEVEQRREPRRSPTNSVNSSLYSSQTSLNSHLPPPEKLLAAKAENKSMEVYVSAIATPSKFWVQLIGRQSKQLDDIVEEMTNYYSSDINRELHRLTKPYLGQIVAAVFKFDGKWYRAEIIGILPNQYNPNEVVYDLYFVDYGDSEYCAANEVYELRTDFLTLRFQAVECFLANIKPTNTITPEYWDPISIQKLEEYTQVAMWKKLTARVVTYKERPKISNGNNNDVSAMRESSPIPGIELFDIAEGNEINIGQMLIVNGFALPIDEQNGGRLSARFNNGNSNNNTQRSDSPATSVFWTSPAQSEHDVGPLTPQSPLTPLSPKPLKDNEIEQQKQQQQISIPNKNQEDEFLEQQLKHLNKNKYLNSSNGNGNGNSNSNGNGNPNDNVLMMMLNESSSHNNINSAKLKNIAVNDDDEDDFINHGNFSTVAAAAIHHGVGNNNNRHTQLPAPQQQHHTNGLNNNNFSR